MKLEFHEGKACDAVIRQLEIRYGSSRANVRSPEQEHDPAPVEVVFQLGDRLCAVEHTGIEPFDGHMWLQNVFPQLFQPVKDAVASLLPDTEDFELRIPALALRGISGNALKRLLHSLATWILEVAAGLPIAEVGRFVEPTHPAPLPNVPFQVSLHRTRFIGTRPGEFRVAHVVPQTIENDRTHRIRTAYAKKLPKLKAWNDDHGARTVLILEDNDIQLTNHAVVAQAVSQIESTLSWHPHEVWLVITVDATTWWLWNLRRDDIALARLQRDDMALVEIAVANLVDATAAFQIGVPHSQDATARRKKSRT